jgi:3-methyladenine DNA glycosylase AlkD
MSNASVGAASMIRALRAQAEPARVAILQRFFRTGPGEYGHGDRFIGVRVPAIRALVRQFANATLADVDALLASPIHEARLLAVLLLVRMFRGAGDDRTRRRIYTFYVSRTDRINSWDLVDVSAPAIVGGWLETRSRAPLTQLARSERVWDRRIAILATQHFIRRGDLKDTFRIAELLLHDEHDLLHKAVGWMLREAGARDPAALRRFLASHHSTMPRTMLRYAIEKFPEDERRSYVSRTPQRPRPPAGHGEKKR